MPASCNPVLRRQLVTKTSFDCLAEVIRALHAQQIPYMLTGAFASNAYGYPRATQDADIVIEYSEGVLRRLRETLGLNYQIDPQPGFEFWLHGFALCIADPCKPAQIRANSTAPYAAPWHH